MKEGDLNCSYSLHDAYQDITENSTEGLKFETYFSLVRVGILIIMGAGMLFTISMLLFAPTFDFIPFGGSGQVLLGVFGTVIAAKIYRMYKFSGHTFLVAGRSTFGDRGRIWKIVSQSIYRRFLFTILFSVAGFVVFYCAFWVFGRWQQATGFNAEGFFADLMPILELIVAFSATLVLLGGILIFAGFILAAWILNRDFRLLCLIIYWRFKAKFYLVSINSFKKILKLDIGNSSDIKCAVCYNMSFKFTDDGTTHHADYQVQCSQCSMLISGVYASGYKSEKNSDEELKSTLQ